MNKWSETFQGVISNIASTKLILGLVSIFVIANQFQSTSKEIQEWAYFLGAIVLIATGHSIFRMLEKQNGKGKESTNGSVKVVSE